jgi:hypothetical protein
MMALGLEEFTLAAMLVVVYERVNVAGHDLTAHGAEARCSIVTGWAAMLHVDCAMDSSH